jgi:hypothetical protein
MQQCPNCHSEQIPEKHWVHQIDDKTRLDFEKPKKLNLYGIFFGSASMVVILLKVFLLADAQAHHGDTPLNPRLGLEMILGAIGLSVLLCIGLLIYREFSYPRKLKWYEDMKKKSKQKYVCKRCGTSWNM